MDSNNPMKQNIKKIVYIMFENRSFDTMLGWLYDGHPQPDVNNIPPGPELSFMGMTTDLQQEFAQPIKYRIEHWDDGDKPIVRGVQRNNFPCVTPILDPEETFKNITYQLYSSDAASGTPCMKGFLQNYYDHQAGYLGVELEILDTYDSTQLPILNTLAREFGISDEWFCSIPSQTSINRAFSICGNSIGRQCKNDSFTTAMVNNHYYGSDFQPAVFTEKTVWQVLADNHYTADADWKIYHSGNYLHGIGGYDHSYTYYLFEGLQGLLKQPGMENKYQGIEQFYEDAANGCLPRFSYLEPRYSTDVLGKIGLGGNDYHPPSDVKSGEKFLAELYEAVKCSPDWENLLFIVAWDEHGGTFDHLAPTAPAICPAKADKYECGFDFKRFGVRVPMLFISPWVTENTVIRSGMSTPFDHTSWLATLLDWFDLEPDLLGARAKGAPKFDQVISNTKRDAIDLPGLWDCKSENEALDNVTLDIRKAAQVARVMAAQDSTVDPVDLLRESLQDASSEADLVKFHQSRTKLK